MVEQKKNYGDAEFYADTMDQEKTTRHVNDFLNRQQSVFNSVYDQGINRRKSVFDDDAIFRTTEKQR